MKKLMRNSTRSWSRPARMMTGSWMMMVLAMWRTAERFLMMTLKIMPLIPMRK
ncbi:hypothetical protein EI555_015107, partial [Monodon monoceros]